MMKLFKIMRRDIESVKDYVVRYNKVLGEATCFGMSNWGKDIKQAHLLWTENLKEWQKRVIGSFGDNELDYYNTRKQVLKIFENEKEDVSRNVQTSMAFHTKSIPHGANHYT